MQTKSYRRLKVENLIRNVLAAAISYGKVLDKYSNRLPISIVRVAMSKDLKIANCYILPQTSVAQEKTNLEKEGFVSLACEYSQTFRRLLAKELKLKFVPEIRFFYDFGTQNQILVDQIYFEHLKKEQQ